MIDINFIKTSKLELDKRIFFDNEACVEIKDFQKTLAQLLGESKIFSSTSEAKRNGWDKEIPKGFSQFIVGKKKHKITIFNEIIEE